jgi:hypothetical protein
MFHDLDETLRQLLIKEIPIKKNEIDIAFDQPKREWTARLNRPTLNIFLYDIRENLKLRHSQEWLIEQQPDGTTVQRRTPVRVDLHYIITAWANEPEDEHNLLARTLMALFRQPHLPQDMLPESLQNQPKPIRLLVAQGESVLRNLADIWNALDNEVRPAVTLLMTLALDPYQPLTSPLVRTRELRIGQSHDPTKQLLAEGVEPDTFWTIGGTVETDKPLEDLELKLVERGIVVPIQDEGQFAIGNLQAGDYTLEIKVNGGKPKRHSITVPAPDYTLEV